MIGRIVLLILICVICGFSTAFAQNNTTAKKHDLIKILDVSAAAPVKDGIENEFTVQIEYTLDTADEATASIGFNSDDPGRYRMVGRKKVTRGTNVLTLKARVIPKDWKDRSDFIVYVNLSPYPSSSARFRPLATADRVVEFEP